MSIELYIAFILASVVLALTPGPAMSLIIANGASFGMAAGLKTVAGNSLGLGILVAAAVLGMSSIMAVMSDWFDLIRWVGAAYLIWLGGSRLWRVLHWHKSTINLSAGRRSRRWFWQGFGVALSNPKVLLFLGAFFPHFVTPESPLAFQFTLLAVTFLVTLTVLDACFAIAAGSARMWLTPSRWRIAESISGCLLVSGGVALALARR